MFERFTDRARRVVVLAQEEARLLDHGWIGTEHILLGLVREGDGVAARVLEEMGIGLDAIRDRVAQAVGKCGDGAPSGRVPFTPRAKKVLELSLREAMSLGHNYIGTEHILLGLLREGGGLAAQVLVELGGDLATARHEVIRMMGVVTPRAALRAYPEMARGIATPAANLVAGQARRLAQGARVGSQHYLLGLLAEQQSLAAKVLTSLGITREAVEAKLAEFDAEGTSDESAEDAGARRMSLRIEADRLVLEVDDPERAAEFRRAASAGVEDAGVEVRTIKGTDAEAKALFPELYRAVGHTLDHLAGRLAAKSVSWPPGNLGCHAAAYSLTTQEAGRTSGLEVGHRGEPVAIRAWLRAWILAERATLVDHAPGAGASSLLLIVDRAGTDYRMFSFGIGDTGDTPLVPVDDLVDMALADLEPPASA